MPIRPYDCRKFGGYENTTPSGYACHPSAGGELPGADTRTPRRRVQTQCNRPRVSALDISSPQERNCPVQIRGHHPVRLRLPPLRRRGIAQCRHEDTTPSGFACHPSRGGELLGADTRTPPRQATPPSAEAVQSQ